MRVNALAPILRVSDIGQSVAWFVKLGWSRSSCGWRGGVRRISERHLMIRARTPVVAAVALHLAGVAGSGLDAAGERSPALQGTSARVELAAFMTIGVQTALEELLPRFEKESGYRVVPTWGTAAILNARIEKGEAADVLISTRAGIDGLVKSGKVRAGSDVELARSGIGIAVRAGAAKPDVSSPDALRRTLLAATSISYSDPAAGGVSGIHFARVLDRLGIAAEMRPKTRFPPPSGFSASLVANGQAELAVQQIPELAMPGVELAGPLPGDLQLITTFVGGVPAASGQSAAAATFLHFLRSPAAVAVLRAKGFEP
jgi:molybdate transport system substrate-binding protein